MVERKKNIEKERYKFMNTTGVCEENAKDRNMWKVEDPFVLTLHLFGQGGQTDGREYK